VIDNWVVPLVSALLGAVVGGLATYLASLALGRRERRARYGEALLASLGAARRKTQQTRAEFDRYSPQGTGRLKQGIQLWEEAAAISAQTGLAASLAWTSAGKRAMQGWALHHHESLLAGVTSRAEMIWLLDQLQVGEYLVIAWVAGDARARDFRLSRDDVVQRFGPKYRDVDMPDYPGPDNRGTS